MAQRKLNIRIHDPYDPVVMAEYLFQLFLEVNTAKADRVLEQAGKLPDTADRQQTGSFAEGP